MNKNTVIIPLPIYTYRQQQAIKRWLDRHGLPYEVNHCDGSITVTVQSSVTVESKTLEFLGY